MHRMTPFFFNRFRLACRVGGVFGALLCAGEVRGQYDPDWVQHFRLGAVAGFNIKADFRFTGAVSIPAKAGIYDDGYVIKNPNNKVNDFTPNWGFDNASQYN